MTHKIILLSLLVTLPFSSCVTNPVDEEQYEKTIYLVGTHEQTRVHPMDVYYQADDYETFVSVACGGSLVQDQDVTVEIEVDPDGVKWYNDKFHPNNLDSLNMLKELPAEMYTIPNPIGVLKVGREPYVRIPVFLKSEQISRDSNYVIPFRIKSISAYKNLDERSHLLMSFNFKNKYSGDYVLNGMKIEEKNTDGVLSYDTVRISIARTLEAVNRNTVRLFSSIFTEDVETRAEYGIQFRVADDNTISILPFNQLEVEDLGGNVFIPSKKQIVANYRYKNPSTNQWYIIRGDYTIPDTK